jgi:hypothetical protein
VCSSKSRARSRWEVKERDFSLPIARPDLVCAARDTHYLILVKASRFIFQCVKSANSRARTASTCTRASVCFFFKTQSARPHHLLLVLVSVNSLSSKNTIAPVCPAASNHRTHKNTYRRDLSPTKKNVADGHEPPEHHARGASRRRRRDGLRQSAVAAVGARQRERERAGRVSSSRAAAGGALCVVRASHNNPPIPLLPTTTTAPACRGPQLWRRVRGRRLPHQRACVCAVRARACDHDTFPRNEKPDHRK